MAGSGGIGGSPAPPGLTAILIGSWKERAPAKRKEEKDLHDRTKKHEKMV